MRSYFLDGTGAQHDAVPPGFVEDSTGGGIAPIPANTVARVRRPGMRCFMEVAHCLWTLLVGYLGGKYAQWLHARGERESAAPA